MKKHEANGEVPKIFAVLERKKRVRSGDRKGLRGSKTQASRSI